MHLPAPLRAAVGLVVTAADEAKHLPDRAIELPMLAVSTALQMSLRAQQRYARLAERGDAALNRRGVSDDPPSWATFDDPVGPGAGDAFPAGEADAAQASTLLRDLFGTDTPTLNGVEVGPRAGAGADAGPEPAAESEAEPSAPRRAAAKRAANGKAVRKPRNGTPSRFDDVEDD